MFYFERPLFKVGDFSRFWEFKFCFSLNGLFNGLESPGVFPSRPSKFAAVDFARSLLVSSSLPCYLISFNILLILYNGTIGIYPVILFLISLNSCCNLSIFYLVSLDFKYLTKVYILSIYSLSIASWKFLLPPWKARISSFLCSTAKAPSPLGKYYIQGVISLLLLFWTTNSLLYAS